MISQFFRNLFRHLSLIFASVVLMISHFASAHAASGHQGSKEVQLEVSPGDWGGVRPEQVEQLLGLVAEDLIESVGIHNAEPLQLRVLPRGGAPRVLYEKGPDGQYLVHLTARGDNWYQYVYQFSHELCHILSNYDQRELTEEPDNLKAADGNQWFEEALCETASLYTLRHMGAKWQQHPPSRNWVGYGQMLEAYADHLLKQDHRYSADQSEMQNWFRHNRRLLKQSPYLRDKNDVVATHLLRLFEANPEQWHSIVYLNQPTTVAGESFEEYLQAWQDACPETDKILVSKTFDLFGLKPVLAGEFDKDDQDPQLPATFL